MDCRSRANALHAGLLPGKATGRERRYVDANSYGQESRDLINTKGGHLKGSPPNSSTCTHPTANLTLANEPRHAHTNPLPKNITPGGLRMDSSSRTHRTAHALAWLTLAAGLLVFGASLML